MERASRRKYHYIYKTTCVITKKFYIGMHSTDNLKDGYIGSGKKLWYSINKHGKENHVCKILEFLPDRSSLKVREMEIVNEDLIGDKMCMNLQLGGGGGFISEEHAHNFYSSGGRAVRILFTKKLHEKMKASPEYKKKITDKIKITKQINNSGWEGKKHSEESKRKIGESNSAKQKGSNNSQYGKCWITNETESKKINKDDTIAEGWRLGRKIS